MENDKTRQQIINEIHKHIGFFQEHWETFCRMVEDHGEHVEKCRNDPACEYDQAEYYRREEQRHELARDLRELLRKSVDAINAGDRKTAKRYNGLIEKKKVEIERLKPDPDPPEPGCVKYEFSNFHYMTNTMETAVFWIKPGPVNPLLWFGLFGNQGIQRGPTDEEELICYCAWLSILHDCEDTEFLEWSEKRIFRKDAYKGTYFMRDDFCWDVFYNKLKGPGGEGLIKRAIQEWRKEAKQIEPDEDTETFVPTAYQIEILEFLSTRHTPTSQVDILRGDGVHMSNKTLVAALNGLKKKGFVSPPEGKINKVIITDKGREYLKTIQSAS